MTTGKVIKKNIKLLLRSRVSTLVLILGPLLIIVLVGISFSTSSFNLKMAAFSESYSELSDNLIDNLNVEGFILNKYDTEEQCVNSVKEQETHACIVFPPDLSVDNDNTNVVEFYVDQSKINLVYLVMSTLESSFGEVTTEISKDLTDNIVSSLFTTKKGLEQAKESIEVIVSNNAVVISNAATAYESLNDLELNAETAVVDVSIDEINDELDELLEDAEDLIAEGLDLVDEVDNQGSLNSNQSNALDDIQDTFEEIEDMIKERHNTSVVELNSLIEDIDLAIEDLSTQLETAENVNEDVLNKLSSLQSKANKVKESSDSLKTNILQMLSNINSVQITNTENIVSPITTKITPLVESKTNLGFLFPSLIVILIMFIGLLLPSTLIIMEKNSRAFFRVFTTPTKSRLFVLATYLTSLFLVWIQVIIILAVSQFYFNINFLKAPLIIFLSLYLIMTFFILTGMLIGYIFNTEEMSMLASVSIATLFLLTSGIIFPIESMPQAVIEKIKYNPVVLGSNIFKKSLLFDGGFASVKTPFAMLFVLTLLILFFIYLHNKFGNYKFSKPKRKVEKDRLISYFNFGDRKAKSLAEFVLSIQNLPDNRFQELLNENAYALWLTKIHNNRVLARQIKDLTTRKDILKVLLEELKKQKTTK